MQKDTEHPQKILVILYTCTFLVFLIEIYQKHYPDLSEGVMSMYENGSNKVQCYFVLIQYNVDSEKKHS